jgi:hypothetical protein
MHCLLTASTLALTLSSLIACSGSDASGKPNADESAGAGNTAGAGQSAGSGNHSAGSTGSAGSTKLSEIKTDAQALAICDQIRATISDQDLQKMLKGSCALQGQTEEASMLGTCEELAADCEAQSALPSTSDGSCTADDIPDCDNVWRST